MAQKLSETSLIFTTGKGHTTNSRVEARGISLAATGLLEDMILGMVVAKKGRGRIARIHGDQQFYKTFELDRHKTRDGEQAESVAGIHTTGVDQSLATIDFYPFRLQADGKWGQPKDLAGTVLENLIAMTCSEPSLRHRINEDVEHETSLTLEHQLQSAMRGEVPSPEKFMDTAARIGNRVLSQFARRIAIDPPEYHARVYTL